METYKDFLGYKISHTTATVKSRWLRFVGGQEYREGMLKVYELIKQNNLKYWLYDASKFSSPNVSDQLWVAEDFTALLATTKLQKTAVLLPRDLIMQTVAEQIHVKAKPVMNQVMQYQSFHDLESAEEWIQESEQHN